MANKNYIQSFYDGSLFEYSKTQKEGFVEHTNTKDKVSYRKYYNKGVGGELLWINRKNNQFLNNREELEFVLASGEDKYYVTFPVLSSNGDEVDDFVEQIVRVLPALNKGEVININNWRMNKGDTIDGDVVKYTNSGVTFKNGEGVKIDPTLSYQTTSNPKGDIPQLQWKEIAGKNRPTAASKEGKLEFLYGILVEETDRLAYSEGGSEPTPKQEPSKPQPKTAAQAFEPAGVEYDDDLPF